MSEPNWIVRIVALLIVVLIFGALVGGYIASNRPPPQQHIHEAVPNDRLPG
ncbi:MAG: hypothetical protein ACTHLR_03900 [Rhizomicrobium sp.]